MILDNSINDSLPRWRVAGGGAFIGWDVLLFASKSKSEPLCRVLIAGGAEVMIKE